MVSVHTLKITDLCSILLQSCCRSIQAETDVIHLLARASHKKKQERKDPKQRRGTMLHVREGAQRELIHAHDNHLDCIHDHM